MSATQNFVKVQAIKDGVVFVGLNKICVIVLVSSLNFLLKSKEEQEAIIYGYQDFLNSLDFPVQILVTSRHVNIDAYLNNLMAIRDREEQEQMRLQIEEYVSFIKALTANNAVLAKNFYLVIPYSTAEQRKGGLFRDLLKSFMPKKSDEVSQNITGENFLQFKTQLWERLDLVVNGLRRIGLNAVPLNTQECVELFYNFYSPEKKPKQDIPDISKIEVRMQ